MCDGRKVSIRFIVFTPNLPLQNDSDRPICPRPPPILSTARDVYEIVCALRAALIAAISVRPNGRGSLLEWIVCICPIPASLAFKLGNVISFGLGRENPS